MLCVPYSLAFGRIFHPPFGDTVEAALIGIGARVGGFAVCHREHSVPVDVATIGTAAMLDSVVWSRHDVSDNILRVLGRKLPLHIKRGRQTSAAHESCAQGSCQHDSY